MKRLLALLALLVLLAPTQLLAASSCTQSIQSVSWSGAMYTVDFNWIAHTDGTFTSVESDWDFVGWIVMVETNPGATAPQALYDITLNSSEGSDLLGSAALNRSATANELTFPYVSGSFQPVPVFGPVTLGISGNNVNSATGLIRVYFTGTFQR